MSSRTEPTLLCEDLTKKFDRLTVLRSLSLKVWPNECVALFGRNGAGKSTLLNIAASLSKSYSGRVRVMGVDTRRSGSDTRRMIGLVSHEALVYADLSVSDNLTFFADLYGIDRPHRRIAEVLEQFGLSDKARSSVRELSRGMKQRLSLARSLLHSPKLLLLDEPFTGLDENSCAAVNDAIRSTVTGGGAVLLTTHDLDRGLNVATRATILDLGRIAHDTAEGGVDRIAFRKVYEEATSTPT